MASGNAIMTWHFKFVPIFLMHVCAHHDSAKFLFGSLKEFFLHNRGLEERFFQICWWEKNKKGICCNVITFFFLCVMASVWSKKLCPLLEVNFVYLDWIITLSREPCVVIFALSFLLLLSFFRQLLITFWCRT